MTTPLISVRLENFTPSRSSTCIFTVRDIEEGEVIETFMALPTKWRLRDLDPRCHSLKENALALGVCSCNFCDTYGTPFLLATGNASLYGNSLDPNARLAMTDFQEGKPSVGKIIANRSIPEGAGVFIDRSRYFISTPADPVPETEEE